MVSHRLRDPLNRFVVLRPNECDRRQGDAELGSREESLAMEDRDAAACRERHGIRSVESDLGTVRFDVQ